MQRLLCSFRWIAVCTQSYLRTHGRPVIPLDLESHQLIVPRSYQSDVLTFDSEDGRQSIEIRSRLSGNDIEFAEDAARLDAGIAIIPDWVLAIDAGASGLEQVLADYYLCPIQIWLVFPESKVLPGRVRTLIEFLLPRVAVRCLPARRTP